MKIEELDLASLFEKFENDIVFDCHSLRTKVSRSQSGKRIIAMGPKILRELAEYLKNWQPLSKIKELEDEEKHGWGILLSWMCEEHSLDRGGIAQNDFESWVKWTASFSSV